MSIEKTDIVIVGAGPVGLMCAYLASLCHLNVVILDKSNGPLKVGRADALNARTLQLLEVINLFSLLYPKGKICNTSSVWSNGKFISRQSAWWDSLKGCLHKHFLMLGQSYIEGLLDNELIKFGLKVKRSTLAEDIVWHHDHLLVNLSNGERILSKYVIGADGSHSFVRKHFQVSFAITRPKIIWAVIDGVIKTDFIKVPEIIVFQNATAEVAWIPREDDIDRFYVRMDVNEFTQDQVVEKINAAMNPYALSFEKIVWYSKFSVKESVAKNFVINNNVFLVGDACHIHSVNGGQGLNTGLGDAFNLIWKLNMTINHGMDKKLLKSYEHERKEIASDVIKISGELVRSTKYSANKSHAIDYVNIIKKHAGYITGMGVRYGVSGLVGTRLFDFKVNYNGEKTRLYSLLNYQFYTLLIFGDIKFNFKAPEFIKVISLCSNSNQSDCWAENTTYVDQIILVRPDTYIDCIVPLSKSHLIIEKFKSL